MIGEVLAELSEERNTETVEAIWSVLPIKGKVNTWGDEVFVPIGVKGKMEVAQQVVEKGDIGYWPGGDAFCIFFGRSPTSVFFNPVNIIGRVLVDAEVFKKVRQGQEITISKAE